MTSSETLYTNLKKSKSDTFSYALKILKNDLKVLMISDTETNKSAASLSVNIGSLLDPKEYQGLAHFCEHMLSMGTKKFPDENDFGNFLSKNSGDSNAYTSEDITNYHFNVSNNAFEEALERFADFFVSSLFSENSVNKEINSIDSENKKNVNNDVWRLYQLMNSESNSKSPFNHFSSGNLKTLQKDDVRDKLLEFYRKYYTSEMMGLCVYSNKPIDTLINIVDKYFINIPKIENYKKPFYGEFPAYDKENSQYIYKIVPIKDKYEIQMHWNLEDESQYYKIKPLSNLSNLFGHEGPNTLISSLSKDDLITTFLVGGENTAKTFSSLYFKINLTNKGFKNYRDVILRCFKYIQIIQGKPINKRFFNEYIKKKQIDFDFKSKKLPLDYCKLYSKSLFDYNNEDILTGNYLIEEYNEDVIKKYLMGLKQENCNIYLFSKEFEKDCNLTEKWYGTKYTKEKFNFSQEEIDNVICNYPLDYPPENLFFPENLDILKEPEEIKQYPENIFTNEKCKIWYKQDVTYKRPKAYIQLVITLEKDIAKNDYIKNSILADIMEEIAKNELRETMYMIEEALLQFSLSISQNKFLLLVNGFNSSMKNTFKIILEEFKKIDYSKKEEQFKIGIENLKQKKINYYFANNYLVCYNYLDCVIKTPSTTAKEQLDLLNKNELTINDLIEFSNNIFNNCKLEWLIQGNLLKEDAIELNDIACEILNINKEDKKLGVYQDIRAVNINEKTNYIYTFYSPNPNEISSSITSFYQCGHLSEFEKMYLYVLEQILKDQFYDDLRTKQSLAYVAILTKKSVRGNWGILGLIQSNVKEPEFISGRIRNFYKESLKLIENLSDDDFKKYVNAVAVNLKKKDTNLEEELKRNAVEVVEHTYMFDRKKVQLKELNKITKEGLIEFYKNHFIEKIKKIDIEYVAECHKENNNKLMKETKIENIRRIPCETIEEFINYNPLFPDFYSNNLN